MDLERIEDLHGNWRICISMTGISCELNMFLHLCHLPAVEMTHLCHSKKTRWPISECVCVCVCVTVWHFGFIQVLILTPDKILYMGSVWEFPCRTLITRASELHSIPLQAFNSATCRQLWNTWPQGWCVTNGHINIRSQWERAVSLHLPNVDFLRI